MDGISRIANGEYPHPPPSHKIRVILGNRR